MYDPEKIKLKSQMVTYAQGEGKPALRLKSLYDKKDGRRAKIVNVACFAAAYILIIAIAFIWGWGHVFSQDTDILVIVLMIAGVLAVGILLMLLYINLAGRYLKKRYDNVRSSLSRYEVYSEKLK